MSINYSIRKGFIPNERWIPRQKAYNYNNFLDDWKNGKPKDYLKYNCKNYKLYCGSQLIAEFEQRQIICYVDLTHMNLIKRFIIGIKDRVNGYFYENTLLANGDTIFILI